MTTVHSQGSQVYNSLNKRTNIIWNGKLRTVKAIAEEIGVPRTSLNKLFRKMGDIELAAREALARRKA